MKVISWNMSVFNKKKNNLPLMLRQKADVFCFQEVSKKHFEELKRTDYNIYHSFEADGKRKLYSIILTKEKAKHHEKIEYDTNHKSVWRFVLAFFAGIKNFKSIGHYVDVGEYRIINLHLHSFASPIVRLQEFNHAMEHKKEQTIVCGDLNTYGVWYLNWFLTFILKIRIRDLLRNEIKEFNIAFKKNNLKNIFKNMKTSTFLHLTRYHTDYILIPTKTRVIEKKVFKKRLGSDHCPIMAKIA